MSKYPEWFSKWKKDLHTSIYWKRARAKVISERQGRCDWCSQEIYSTAYLEHKIEITPDNKDNEDLVLGIDNLILLCSDCHQIMHTGKVKNKVKHEAWFRDWQLQFYNSKEWIALRNEVRDDFQMRCAKCKRLIRGTGRQGQAFVDHIIEIDENNYKDEDITLNKDNLQLLCFECHNTKTFGNKIEFNATEERKVNLF